MTSALRRAAVFFALPITLLAIWWFASAGSTDFLMPPLAKILEVFPETWSRHRLTHDVAPSLIRLAVGFAGALLIGIGAGVVIGSSRVVRLFAEPVLEFLRAIPPPALVPIFILVAGIDNVMKVLVIISGCVWPIVLNTVEGVRGADPVLAETCRSYRIGEMLRLRMFVLRSASPQIVTGARQALSIGIILMVISEMKAASEGLGFTIREFQTGYQFPQMWSGVLLLGLIGVVLSLLFRVAENRVLVWYHGQRAAARVSR
ncbi:nitrate ABC transporter permease [Rhizocola hellebori]|uniref:Nitrate ABC transporter permease n=1 Tax=Rhizocola hellebori TaxID=1392758 RepID=A0A8J3VGI1_9ACTN|nr:ABC transporter permease [Rhizocola hellebori]GIH04918.1 nitrate ABC transporter permease [Rhizocola hellebori]